MDDGVLRPDELSAVNDPAKVESTVHWCTADLAWVTAHTYEIYGPLVNGVHRGYFRGYPPILRIMAAISRLSNAMASPTITPLQP